jgi:purine-binding chemotaxis protein CheW
MSDKAIKVLIFNINDEFYAADIMEVERILGYEESTRLPDSPDFVEGVINHEGSILPVINLAKRFNLKNSENKRDSKIVVAKQEKGKIGIIVDIVSEVKDISVSTIENPPEVVSGISKRYIKGLIKVDRKIIIFLKLSDILTEEERQLIL